MSQSQCALVFAESPFNFETHQVRITASDEGELWFAAQDVMDSLEYTSTSKPSKVLAHVPDEWKDVKPIHTPGGQQKLLCLSEPGLYFFLGRSDKPKALPFQKWLAGEVLPSIRQTGSFGTPRIDPAAPVPYTHLTLPTPYSV
ncbi:BRO-N domain-containing protein [Bordetella avium]|uniref:BRO-N domain-containing protein n=1 Tax=Bordetella avium TaxID=521 RepID=UPI00068B7684|nr:BRO family protein [Bordetella avium]